MPRNGPEPKPTWQQVPWQVRHAVEKTLGTRVERAMRAWGGYAPSPTFRLRLANGETAFLKASFAGSDNEFMKAAHVREERFCRDLADVIAPWAPRMIASFEVDEWSVMLLEDLGPKSAPPWTHTLAKRVIQSVAEFHSTTAKSDLPSWLRRTSQLPSVNAALWRGAPSEFGALAELAGMRRSDALSWLNESADRLRSSADAMEDCDVATCFIHLDIRSDNLRWTNGRLYLFDWPHAGVGPPEYDAAAFAQSVETEGGPAAELVMAWYAERHPVNQKVLDGAVASFAGYFANRSWAPEIPGLPRVRSFQRAQLKVSLKWAAKRLGLATPDWVDAIPTPNWP